MENTNISRRRFFVQVLGITGAAVLAPTLLKAQEKRRSAAPAAGGGALPLVDPKDPVAKAVKYVEDAKLGAEMVAKLAELKTESVILEGDTQAFLGKAVEIMDLAKSAGAKNFSIAAEEDPSKRMK